MPRKKRAPWIKLFGDYASSPSHAELDDRALWTGVALMQLIRAGCDARGDREPWALQESGKPCSVYAIAQQARQPHAIAQRGLNLLVDAGTAARRDDGAYGVPKFWRFQEHPDTEKKRKSGTKPVPDSGAAPPTLPVQEDRGQSVLYENTPVVPTGDPPPNPLVAHVLAEMASAVRELKPDLRGPRDTPANRKAIAKVTKAQSLTPDLWTQAIRAQLESVRPNPEHWGYLSLSTLCVPRNMARLLEAPLAKLGAGSNQGGLPSFDDYERASAEENARATR